MKNRLSIRISFLLEVFMAENISKQVEQLKRGTVEIFNEGELAERLTEADKRKTPASRQTRHGSHRT